MIRRHLPPLLGTDRSRSWGLALGTLVSTSLVACSSSTTTPPDFGSSGTASESGSVAATSGSQAAGGTGSTDSTTGSTSASGSVGSTGAASSTGSGSGSGTSSAHADGGADAGTHADGGKVTGDSGGIVGADGGACPAPSGITSQQTTALQIINQTRAAMGSPCATDVPTLNTSATKHCQYYAANASNMTCIANPHVEVQSSSCTGYVAAQFYDRETAAGYMCQPSLTQMCGSFEVMAFDDNPTYALAQWIGSIYHRTPVLDPRTRDFGYGNATGCDTIDFGEGAGSTTASNVIVSYPYDGQTGVGTSFNGAEEEPTPPVPPNGWPSAMPITIFMEATSVTLTTDEFGVDGGAMLAHQVMTPQSNNLVTNALVLYGNAPLTAQTKYRVHVAGTRSTQSFSGSTSSAMFDVSFAFTTM